MSRQASVKCLKLWPMLCKSPLGTDGYGEVPLGRASAPGVDPCPNNNKVKLN